MEREEKEGVFCLTRVQPWFCPLSAHQTDKALSADVHSPQHPLLGSAPNSKSQIQRNPSLKIQLTMHDKTLMSHIVTIVKSLLKCLNVIELHYKTTQMLLHPTSQNLFYLSIFK